MILATVLVAVSELTVSEPGTVLSTYILMTTAIVMMMKMLLLLSCNVLMISVVIGSTLLNV